MIGGASVAGERGGGRGGGGAGSGQVCPPFHGAAPPVAGWRRVQMKTMLPQRPRSGARPGDRAPADGT